MTNAHLINILIHASAGIVAMIIGFIILLTTKGTHSHKRWGKIFCYFALIVCVAAATGLMLFRFLPLFAVITLLVSYQLVGGWRSAITQHQGPNIIDAIWTSLAILFSFYLIPIVFNQPSHSSVVLYSTYGALVFILFYDVARWFFPRAWYRFLWRYEHSYKLLSSLFGMLSALVGNVVRAGQPWSQLAPSAIGIMVIGFFFYRLFTEDKKV